MDGENKGKPYEQIDDLGVALFLETPIFTTQQARATYCHIHMRIPWP